MRTLATLKGLAVIFAVAFLGIATCKAQELYVDTTNVPRPASFCIEFQQDAYDIALSKNWSEMWAVKKEQGKCGTYTLPWFYARTLNIVGKDRVAEIRIKLTSWQTVYVVWEGDLDATLIAWDDSPYKGWADKQQVMPAARKRVGCADAAAYCSCCNGAEIVKSKFRPIKGTSAYDKDGWEWLNIRTNKWERVSDDIIHWDEPTPDKQAVAFEYPIGSGKLRCFFPPQDGGI